MISLLLFLWLFSPLYAFETSFPLETSALVSLGVPPQWNPQHQSWWVEYQSEIQGFEAVPEGKFFRARLQSVRSHPRVYLRADPSWYRVGDSSCTPSFASDRAKEAIEIWEKSLQSKIHTLKDRLAHIRAIDPEAAFQEAETHFKSWMHINHRRYLFFIEKNWLPKDPCRRVLKGQSWSRIQDKSDTLDTSKAIARVPARLWDGWFVVKLEIRFGLRTLVGKFLIDPEAKQSLLAPSLLLMQGIEERVLREHAYGSTLVSAFKVPKQVAELTLVDSVRLSGVPLLMRAFALLETDLFSGPSYATSCCDGVLGQDFLSEYAAHFEPSIPTHLKLFSFKQGLSARLFPHVFEWFWPHIGSPTALLRGQGGETVPVSSPMEWSQGWYSEIAAGRLALSSLDKWKEVKGVKLVYKQKGPRRRLVVEKNATMLMDLKPACQVYMLDGQNALDLDQWQVDRILSGDLHYMKRVVSEVPIGFQCGEGKRMEKTLSVF